MHPFSIPWKHPKIWYFQGVEKGCIGTNWVNVLQGPKHAPDNFQNICSKKCPKNPKKIQRCSVKKVFLKKRLQHRSFPVNFVNFKNIFFTSYSIWGRCFPGNLLNFLKTAFFNSSSSCYACKVWEKTQRSSL